MSGKFNLTPSTPSTRGLPPPAGGQLRSTPIKMNVRISSGVLQRGTFCDASSIDCRHPNTENLRRENKILYLVSTFQCTYLLAAAAQIYPSHYYAHMNCCRRRTHAAWLSYAWLLMWYGHFSAVVTLSEGANLRRYQQVSCRVELDGCIVASIRCRRCRLLAFVSSFP